MTSGGWRKQSRWARRKVQHLNLTEPLHVTWCLKCQMVKSILYTPLWYRTSGFIRVRHFITMNPEIPINHMSVLFSRLGTLERWVLRSAEALCVCSVHLVVQSELEELQSSSTVTTASFYIYCNKYSASERHVDGPCVFCLYSAVWQLIHLSSWRGISRTHSFIISLSQDRLKDEKQEGTKHWSGQNKAGITTMWCRLGRYGLL